MEAKVFFLLQPMMDGNPKYFSFCLMAFTPHLRLDLLLNFHGLEFVSYSQEVYF